MSYRDSDYCSGADLAEYLRDSIGADDAQMALAVTAASRAIDRACARSFGLDDAAVTRTYPIAGGLTCAIDDVQTTDDLVVSMASAPWPATPWKPLTRDTDYELLPLNAAVDGRPWDQVRLAAATTCTRIQVTARFGWTSIPDVIVQATLLQSSRFLHRRESPFGVAGSPDLGSELRLLERLDPDVAVMVAGYRRLWGAV